MGRQHSSLALTQIGPQHSPKTASVHSAPQYKCAFLAPSAEPQACKLRIQPGIFALLERATVACFYMTTQSSLTNAALTSGQPPSISSLPHAVPPPSNLRRANKGLMETVANSEFTPTNWDHRHLAFPNRNNKTLFVIDEPNSNRQLETIRNRRNSFTIMQMTFSNRPKKTEVAGGPTTAIQRQPAGRQRYIRRTQDAGRMPAVRSATGGTSAGF
jgi:hypothetical protein